MFGYFQKLICSCSGIVDNKARVKCYEHEHSYYRLKYLIDELALSISSARNWSTNQLPDCVLYIYNNIK